MPLISALIYGCRVNQVGWEPQYTLNNPPETMLNNMGAAGVDPNVKNYYTVKTTPNYTMYTLAYTQKFVKSFDGLRPGATKIAVFIPAGYKLADGETPWSLLNDLNKAMIENSWITDPITGGYKYKEKLPDASLFAELLGRYRLEPAKAPHRPMSSSPTAPVGMVMANGDMASKLLADVAYPEFATYKEVVVTPAGKSENMVNVEIPRRPKFDIYADGMNITGRIAGYRGNYEDVISIDPIAVKGLNPVAWEAEPVRFTIAEALKGTVPGVTVDTANERVNIALNTRKRTATYTVKLTGKTDPQIFHSLQVTFNGRPKQLSRDHTVTLEGDELLTGPAGLNFSSTTPRYGLAGRPTVIGNVVSVPMRDYKPSPSPTPFPGPSPRNSIQFTVSLEDPKDLQNAQAFYPVILENLDHYNKEQVKFHPADSNGRAWTSSIIEMPLSYAGRYEIHLKTDCVKIEKGTSVTINKDTTDVLIRAKATRKLGLFDRKPGLAYGAIGAVAVLLLCVIGYFAWGYFKPKEQTPVANVSVSPPGQLTQPEVAGGSLNIVSMKARLENPAVTFAEIEEMDSLLTQNAAQLDSIGKDLKAQIADYMKVIKILKDNHKPEVFAPNILDKALKGSKVNQVHIDRVKQLWLNRNNTTEVQPAFKELRKMGPFKSFKDIPDFETIYIHAPAPKESKPQEQPKQQKTKASDPDNSTPQEEDLDE